MQAQLCSGRALCTQQGKEAYNQKSSKLVILCDMMLQAWSASTAVH